MFKAIKHWLWVHDIDDITLCCWGAIASFVVVILAMVALILCGVITVTDSGESHPVRLIPLILPML